MPASCVPQGRKGPDKTSGADARDRLDQARASARRPLARIDSGGTPPVRGRTGQAALSPSARAGSCAPGMPPSRLRQGRGAALQACRPPAYGKGGELRSRHAALSPTARAERSQQSHRRGRASASCTSAALSRRSRARIDSGGTPRLEIRKCTSERKTQCLCGFRHLHTCTSEEGMYK